LTHQMTHQIVSAKMREYPCYWGMIYKWELIHPPSY
jgi:hypothetical protein